MADPEKVKQICNELGVSTEEARSSLEENGWSVDLAMAACRQKHVPHVEFESLSSVSLNEKSTTEAGCSSSNSPREEEPSPELKKELIDSFREVAPALSPQDAFDILQQFNWDLQRAVNHFMDGRDLQTKSDSDSDDEYKDEDEDVPLATESSYSHGKSLMDVDVDILPMASSQLQIQESSSTAQIREEEELLPPSKVDRVCNTVCVARQEALYYVDGSSGDLDRAMEACRSKTLLPSPVVSNEIQPEPVPLLIRKGELTISFCDRTGASFEDALDCLTRCKWRIDDAVGYFKDKCSGNLNSQRIPEGDHSTIGQSSSQGASEDVASKALPSHSQLQAPIGSSSSLMNIDPTKKEEAINEASGESVAITPMRSSQVDGKAVEDDSSMEIEITFPDDTKVNFPFRPDQTVRDILNAIEALRPDESRDCYLMSRTSEVYKGLSTTVAEISTRGSTSLMLLYHD